MCVGDVTAPGALMGLALTSPFCKDVRAGLGASNSNPADSIRAETQGRNVENVVVLVVPEEKREEKATD